MLFGTRPLGFVETTQPVILFCVLFGLSMDYEVFLLTRMRETWRQPATTRWRSRPGSSGAADRHVRGAHVIVVAGSFAFADIVLIKALGVGSRSRSHSTRRSSGAARPGDDAAPGEVELVAAPVPRTPLAVGRGRGERYMRRRVRLARWLPHTGARCCRRERLRGRTDPGQPAAHLPSPAVTPGLTSRPRTHPPRVPPRRRPPRPPHRVVVLHRPPPGRQRPSLRVRSGRVSCRAQQRPDRLGIAPRNHGRGERPVLLRAAQRSRAAGRSVEVGRSRRANGLRAADRRTGSCARRGWRPGPRRPCGSPAGTAGTRSRPPCPGGSARRPGTPSASTPATAPADPVPRSRRFRLVRSPEVVLLLAAPLSHRHRGAQRLCVQRRRDRLVDHRGAISCPSAAAGLVRLNLDPSSIRRS